MQKTLLLSLFLLGSWLTIAANNQYSISSDTPYTFLSNGVNRTYYIHLPDNLPKEAPLVFTLHGYGGNAKDMIKDSKMNEVADKNGFAVCYPQGNFGVDQKNSWNAGYSNPTIDDVTFLAALAKYLQQAYQLSVTNTFCTGMSNGADMSYVLACQRPDVFAAIAPVAGCMMQTTFDACQSSKAVPIFEVHGTKDEITLWEGDATYSDIYGGYLGTREIIDFWVKKNVGGKPMLDTLPNVDKTDGSFIVSEKYNGANNKDVWLYTLVDGQHDWPGTWGNKDIQASEVIWTFFQQFIKEPKKEAPPIAKHFPKSTPEAEGVSSAAILQFLEKAEKEIDAIHSFMFLKNGRLISEGWWAPYDAATPHVMHSLSKSFTSTAIGMAIAEGSFSLDDPILSFFPEDAPKDPSWQLKAMRIRDLITMNTGHIEEPMVWGSEGNWVKKFLAAEVPLKPGTHFKYNSAATYMLSAILQKVTGEKLVDYLDTRLFQPLQIQKPKWDTCPKGINTGGWGLRITTEDIAKLGQLYLQKGHWNGQQLLSSQWVEMATSKQVANGSDPANDWEQGYGFQFWRCRHNNYRGDGAFGQFCIVLPEQDAVLAITSGVNDMGAVMELVWDNLLPAMQNTPLPSNPTQLKALQLKTNQLRLPPITGLTSSKIAKKISNKRFTIAPNDRGIQSVAFNIGKLPHTITFETEQGEMNIPIGYGTYTTTTTSQQIPYTDNLQKNIASSGAWITPNEYQVRVYLTGMPARITYNFQFDNGTLVWDSQLEHSLFGPQTQPQLVGE